MGYVTSTVYDNAGQTTATIDALAFATSFTYDANGNRTVSESPLGFLTTTVYSAANSNLGDRHNRCAQ